MTSVRVVETLLGCWLLILFALGPCLAGITWLVYVWGISLWFMTCSHQSISSGQTNWQNRSKSRGPSQQQKTERVNQGKTIHA